VPKPYGFGAPPNTETLRSTGAWPRAGDSAAPVASPDGVIFGILSGGGRRGYGSYSAYTPLDHFLHEQPAYALARD
jgi:hypothetical protein